jgi:polar amino acid transport system ATP-binding protein
MSAVVGRTVAGFRDSPPGNSIIQFEAAQKSFGDHCVLSSVSFVVPAGQKLVIIGPSGSGKTTILRCLMTLESLDSGSIELDGIRLDYGSDRSHKTVPPQVLRKARERIGMVFQQFNLFPHMNVLKNIALAPRRVLHLGRQEAEHRAIELLSLVGLSEKAKSFPHQLSGGQQQRVAIARALALQPKILLFDEVTSALDPELVGEVTKVIRNLASATRTTMLIVTHEMQFAAEIADRVLFIEDGGIVEDGPPEVIFRHPKSERTGQFLRALSDR